MTVFNYDTTALDKLVKGLRSIPNAVETATSRSINRTLTTVRKEITTRVREDYNVKAGAIKSGIPIKKANTHKLEGRLHTVGGLGVPLIDYQARTRISPSRVPSTTWTGARGRKKPGPKRGVSGLVRRATGRTIWQGSFVSRMPTGHRGVFIRVPGKTMRKNNRPAIREMYGPSAARILVNGRYTQDIVNLTRITMRKNMQSEKRYILNKLGKL